MTLRLRQKFLLIICGFILAMGLAVSFFIKTDITESLETEMRQRGVSMARHIASVAAEGMLADDRLSLKLLALGELAQQSELRYIFFLDNNQKIVAHTFEGGFPVALLPLHQGSRHKSARIELINTGEEDIYDISVDILKGGLGEVRLGLSADSVNQAITKVTREVFIALALMLTIGAILAGILTNAITLPIRKLATAAEAIGLGDFSQRVPDSDRDELGRLGAVFNQMASNLEKTTGELVERNRDLDQQITHRKKAENSLAEQRDFFQVLLDDIPLPVFYKDLRGHFLGCNNAFEEFFSRGRQDVIGKSSADMFPPPQAEKHLQVDTELIANLGSRAYEMSAIRADGESRQIIFHKATYTDSYGNVAGLIGVMQDVSTEREISRLKSEFVSTVAHEFQTPLATILGFSELLLEHPEACEGKQDEFVEHIHTKAGALSILVDQLLDLTRLESGKLLSLQRSDCQIDKLLRRVVDDFSNVDQNHHYELQIKHQQTVLNIDEARLTQVVENLLSNARKYSPKGTIIRVQAEKTDLHYLVRVTDQGRGMTESELEKLFDKFYRADTSDTAPSGTGLGMYIVHSIIEAHSGSISASSEPAEGTTISFSLPT